jgi:hypothetical protein
MKHSNKANKALLDSIISGKEKNSRVIRRKRRNS